MKCVSSGAMFQGAKTRTKVFFFSKVYFSFWFILKFLITHKELFQTKKPFTNDSLKDFTLSEEFCLAIVFFSFF